MSFKDLIKIKAQLYLIAFVGGMIGCLIFLFAVQFRLTPLAILVLCWSGGLSLIAGTISLISAIDYYKCDKAFSNSCEGSRC